MGRIVIIHHSGLIGGAGVSLMNTIRELSSLYDVFVTIPDDPGDMIKALNDLEKSCRFSIHTYGRRIGALTNYSGGDRLMSLRFLYRTSLICLQWRYWNRLIRTLDPEIVIVNSVVLSWMSMLPEVKKRKSVCFVRETIRGDMSRIYNRIVRRLLLRFNKVSFLTEYDRTSWDFPDSKSEVIRNYVDPEVLEFTASRDDASSSFGLRSDSFHLLYVGGVSFMKGFDLAVNAVLDCQLDVELIVAGVDFEDKKAFSGGKLSAYESQMSDYIEKRDVDHRIHFIGRQMNMSMCYSAADAVVFPMRSPHQARPAFEAGWYSIPVIITDFANIKENVKEGVNGLVFQPGNVDSLRLQIEYLASHPLEAKELGKNNRNHTLRFHNKEINNLQIRTLVDSVS